ncbi:nuclear transport factor 2 family protein [Burkholderia ubonensis]|uniref:nuclear transport factor 2 family protein n=1 Tax=Burkholderia ubonensis TaxID=101571 RepID=UPI000A590C68|nr:nuclear transport factor 2 family protein [Burkholderia ubonensis]
MSKAAENRQLIMDYFAAWERGDVKAGESFWADDFVSYQAGHSALAGKYNGPRDFDQRWIQPLLKMTNNRWYVSNQPEIILSGEDGVVVIVKESMERDGKGRIDTEKLVVYTIQDKKIKTCRMYDGDQGAIDDFWA